jgi:hypothetical protein
MAQIFVSHSRQDRQLVDYFSRVAAGTNVRLVFEELEKMVSGEVSAAKIRADIEASNAVFVLITKQLHAIPHTRDWVLWESGVATNRDIWVFEPIAELGRVTVITPFLKNYVLFEPSDSWFPYVRQIVDSYDDSHVLATTLAGGGLGAAIGREKGAMIGAGIALLLAGLAKPRPQGIPIACANCASSYSVHVPVNQVMLRCPVCNTLLQLALPSTPLAALASPIT